MRKRKPTPSEMEIWNEFQNPTDRYWNGLPFAADRGFRFNFTRQEPYTFPVVEAVTVKHPGRPDTWKLSNGVEVDAK